MRKTEKINNLTAEKKEYTKTFLNFLQSVHDYLSARFDWYYFWHKYPYHRQIHYAILIVSTIATVIMVGVLVLFGYSIQTAYAPLIRTSYDVAKEPGSGFSGQGTMLFDISLSIDNPLLDKAGDLVAQVKFESFGNVPIPVDLTYKIYKIVDASGISLIEDYSETDKVTVETEKIITKDFKNLQLESGKYSLALTTVYGDGVKDEFRQTFEIKEGLVSKEKSLIVAKVVLILFVAGLGGFGIFRFMKRKK